MTNDLKQRLREGVRDTGVLIATAAEVNARMYEAADRIEQLESEAAGYRWLRDRIGVTPDKYSADGAYVWIPGGSSKINDEDRRKTDAAILGAIAKGKN